MILKRVKLQTWKLMALFATASALLFVSASHKSQAQSIKIDRDRGREMLSTIKDELKARYYDENFHGMDVEARFKVADERIKNADSNSEIFGIIAQVLLDLNDSHTAFLPPDRVARFEYGWRMQMIGDQCYVIEVVPGSDAAAKGLKVGSVIGTADGYSINRENLWKFEYLYYRLKPRTGITLVVQDPNGETRQMPLATAITEGEDLYRERETARKREEEQKKAGTSPRYPRYHNLNDSVIICKLPRFTLREKEVDEMMKRIKPYKSLILDLRRNGGGYERTLTRLVGYFFDRDVKIADLKSRDKTKPLIAKSQGKNAFKGDLVVLVDSRSASASELFARVVQLEKRGLVIGDQTAGSVMRGWSVSHDYTRGPDAFLRISYWGVSITVADGIMSDGKSLEKIGVKPDETVLPTGKDLATRRDSALSRAAAILGVTIDPRQAGVIFPPDSTGFEEDNEEGDNGERTH